MFLEWLYPLAKYFGPFNVFQYLTFRSAYAAVTALVITYLFGPKIIAWLKVIKFGQSIRQDGPATHLVKSGTPTMGGIFIVLAVCLSVIFWQDLKNMYTWLMLFTLVGFASIGFLDDWVKVKYKNPDGISARLKLVLQFIVAFLVVLSLFLIGAVDSTTLYIPFFKNAVIDLGIFWIPLAMIYVVGWSNAVNISDGLDGLATGLYIIALIAIAVISYITGRADFSNYLAIPFIQGSSEITVFAFALMGACVGFLWFNSHPAEVFMGDVGSLALGGVLGVFGLILKKEILMLVIGGMFIIELASTALQIGYYKLSKGKRIFKMAPIHHHFELCGWKETKVVVRFWLLGGIFALVALSTLKIQ